MSTAVWTNQLEPNSVADKALKAAAGLWFLVRHRPVGVFVLHRSLLRPLDVYGKLPGLEQEHLSQHGECSRGYRWKSGFCRTHATRGRHSLRRGDATHSTDTGSRHFRASVDRPDGFRNGVGAQRLRPLYGMGAWQPHQHGRRGGDAHVVVLSEVLDNAANCTSDAALQDQDCRKANF
jgi:hypothetical protein